MRRRYGEYLPTGWRLRRYGLSRRYRLFRSAQLNAAGWAAVAACCLAGAAIGSAVGFLVGWPVAIWAGAGALLSLGALVVVDRRRCGRIWVGYSWGDTARAADGVAGRLRRRGLAVESTAYPDGRGGLRYRHRDGRRVARALNDLGVPPPPGSP